MGNKPQDPNEGPILTFAREPLTSGPSLVCIGYGYTRAMKPKVAQKVPSSRYEEYHIIVGGLLQILPCDPGALSN